MIVLLQDRAGWSVGRFTADGPSVDCVVAGTSSPEECAEQIREFLVRDGKAVDAVLLAIASSECLARRAMIEDPALVRDRAALAYAWEVWFPSAAEDLVMDFVVGGKEVLGVAVRSASLTTLVQALEVRGIAVQSIVPAALLALQGAIDASAVTAPSSTPGVVLWGNGDDIELMLLKDGKPIDWRIVPADVRALKREFEILSLDTDSAIEVVAYDLSAELQDVVSTLNGVQLSKSGGPTFVASVMTAAHDVLAGVCVPWVELRRGDLAATDPYRPTRRAIRFATIAGCLFLLSLSAAMWIRSQRYQHEILRCADEQGNLYRALFPGHTIPVGVRSRMESELTRLAGRSGLSSDSPERTSALETLDQLLSSLPSEWRYRVRELRVDGARVYLEGEVRSHGDADRIAASLRQGGFDVDFPHSQQLPDNVVSVQLDAVRHALSSPGGSGTLGGDGL